MAFVITNASAIACLDTLVDRCDIGGTGTIRILSGSAPADADATETGTLLAVLTPSATAFGNAADANPGAVATANAVTQDSSADNSGTAGYFRHKNGSSTVIWQGACGTSGQQLNLVTTTIVATQPVSISSYSVTLLEQ